MERGGSASICMHIHIHIYTYIHSQNREGVGKERKGRMVQREQVVVTRKRALCIHEYHISTSKRICMYIYINIRMYTHMYSLAQILSLNTSDGDLPWRLSPFHVTL